MIVAPEGKVRQSRLTLECAIADRWLVFWAVCRRRDNCPMLAESLALGTDPDVAWSMVQNKMQLATAGLPDAPGYRIPSVKAKKQNKK